MKTFDFIFTRRWRAMLAAMAIAGELAGSAFAQGTAFTYQGRLNDG